MPTARHARVRTASLQNTSNRQRLADGVFGPGCSSTFAGPSHIVHAEAVCVPPQASPCGPTGFMQPCKPFAHALPGEAA